MNKAFIFDMDGVIVNSEIIWADVDAVFYPKLFGQEIYDKIKSDILGNTIDAIYALAQAAGTQVTRQDYVSRYDLEAQKVYERTTLTTGIIEFIQKLKTLGFLIGLVSASRQNWINIVLAKFPENCFDYVLSINDTGLKPKPDPEGYLKAMEALGSAPANTIILEDSNRGVKSAKASGALTICLREHLSADYPSQGADVYVETLNDLLKLLGVIQL